jgi:hypothetical protein
MQQTEPLSDQLGARLRAPKLKDIGKSTSEGHYID